MGWGLGDIAGGVGSFALGGPVGLGIYEGATNNSTDTNTFSAEQTAAMKKERDQKYLWAGREGGAAGDAGYYQGMGNQYAAMNAPQMDYGNANQYAALGDQARGSQSNALGLMQSAAEGNAPSQAAILMKKANDQAVANQMSMAAGARGPAAMALAQQNALANQSASATNSANDIGALRAQEMANARNAYMQGASGMRGQDLGYMGQSAQMAQAQGQLGLGYKQMGMQGALGFSRLGFDVNNAQLNAQMESQREKDQQAYQQAQVDANSRDANASNWKSGIKMGLDFFDGGAAGAKKMGKV